KDVDRLAQVDALGAEAARVAVARGGNDRLMPIHGARTVDHRQHEVDPRGERLVILAEPLDDHRLRLLHHANALRDQDDDAEDHRADEDCARTHRLVLLLDIESRTIQLNDRDMRAGFYHSRATGCDTPDLR